MGSTSLVGLEVILPMLEDQLLEFSSIERKAFEYALAWKFSLEPSVNCIVQRESGEELEGNLSVEIKTAHDAAFQKYLGLCEAIGEYVLKEFDSKTLPQREFPELSPLLNRLYRFDEEIEETKRIVWSWVTQFYDWFSQQNIDTFVYDNNVVGSLGSNEYILGMALDWMKRKETTNA